MIHIDDVNYITGFSKSNNNFDANNISEIISTSSGATILKSDQILSSDNEFNPPNQNNKKDFTVLYYIIQKRV